MVQYRLTERSVILFRHFLKIGCICRFLPYEWNETTNNLMPTHPSNRKIFNLQKNFHLGYTVFMWIRFLHPVFLREFSLISAIWCPAISSSCLAYISMSVYTNELMHFSNRVLNRNLLGSKEFGTLK